MGNNQGAPRTKIGKTLTEANVIELSSLSGYTPDQVRVWHAGFLKDCPTGKLNKKKFVEVYKQFYPMGKAEKFCEYVFRTFDNDSSGNIDFGEFLIAISITAQQDPKKKLEWAFTMYDIDRNGFIEKKEMKKIMDAIFDLLGEDRKGSNSPEMKVDQIFSQMDVNGDGKLSKEEFVSGMRRSLLRATRSYALLAFNTQGKRYFSGSYSLSKSLAGSKTHENLKEAFAGESQANRRYLAWAKQADIEGQPDVANVFRNTAEGETGHAFGHLDFLARVGDPATGKPIGTTAKNLEAAIAGETYEYTEMYPGFAKTAREEGFDDIAEWFETLAMAEKSHAGRFKRALKEIN